MGIEDADSFQDIEWLTSKISKLRIFPDDKAAMNQSALDIDAEFLVVSQFTLFATTQKGNRPSFTRSGNPKFAQKMCADFVNELSKIFNKLQIDTHSVLEAAGTKWNFLPFKPGLVGGHCIGVDPYYLTYKANEITVVPQNSEPFIQADGELIGTGTATFSLIEKGIHFVITSHQLGVFFTVL